MSGNFPGKLIQELSGAHSSPPSVLPPVVKMWNYDRVAFTPPLRGEGLTHHLAHPADAARQHAHDVHGEIRHLVDHEAERAPIDHRELAVLFHARSRGARLGV